jgi:hypothetical protein
MKIWSHLFFHEDGLQGEHLDSWCLMEYSSQKSWSHTVLHIKSNLFASFYMSSLYWWQKYIVDRQLLFMFCILAPCLCCTYSDFMVQVARFISFFAMTCI